MDSTYLVLVEAVREFLNRGPGGTENWTPGEDVDNDDLATAVVAAAIDFVTEV